MTNRYERARPTRLRPISEISMEEGYHVERRPGGPPAGEFMLPRDEALWPIRRRVWLTYAAAMIFGGALYFHYLTRRTDLVAQIDPTFHAAMIGAGVFVGILFAAVLAQGWRAGVTVAMRPNQSPPGLVREVIALVALVGIFGLGGSYLARIAVDWRAFHGLHPTAEAVSFTVIGTESSRSSTFVDVQAFPGGRTIPLRCGWDTFRAARAGPHIVLPVQTGRAGVQRVLIRGHRLAPEELLSA